jgi:hypothetical protein
MRILAVAPGPDFSVADVHNGWCEALTELGCHVVDFNLGERLTFYTQSRMQTGPGAYGPGMSAEQAIGLALNGLYAALYVTQPDVLFVTSGFYLTAQVLLRVRHNGTRIVLLHTESPYEDDRQIERAAYADVNLVNDPTNLERFRLVAPTWYAPHAYRPSVHHPRPTRAGCRSDFAFIGTGYPSRVDFFERVDWSGLDVAFAGNWPTLARGTPSPLAGFLAHDPDVCCDNTDAVDLYAGTKVSANLYRREADRPGLVDGWAMSPREVEMAATGTFFIRDPRGESDEVFPMLPTFSDPEDFGEQVRWWVHHDKQRRDAADAARGAVAGRTFTEHARMVLRLLGQS